MSSLSSLVCCVCGWWQVEQYLTATTEKIKNKKFDENNLCLEAYESPFIRMRVSMRRPTGGIFGIACWVIACTLRCDYDSLFCCLWMMTSITVFQQREESEDTHGPPFCSTAVVMFSTGIEFYPYPPHLPPPHLPHLPPPGSQNCRNNKQWRITT